MGSLPTLIAMTSILRVLPFSLLCLAPLVAGAQERPDASEVPREMLPPAGKCRIWMDGVSPSQQPAPTDCQTALRQRPATGTVVFGPATKDAPVRSLVRPRPARDTTARETRPSRSARPVNSSTRSDSSSRRRPEPQF
jgi:hypothetical protein